MGHHTCCNQQKVKRGLWSPEEDEKLIRHITTHGYGCWSEVPDKAGLQRCGKSCRLRWINYLRPDIRRGRFTQEEEKLIISLHEVVGNRWAQIASHLPGRTDNEIKNYWNSWIKKKIRKPSRMHEQHLSGPALHGCRTNTTTKYPLHCDQLMLNYNANNIPSSFDMYDHQQQAAEASPFVSLKNSCCSPSLPFMFDTTSSHTDSTLSTGTTTQLLQYCPPPCTSSDQPAWSFTTDNNEPLQGFSPPRAAGEGGGSAVGILGMGTDNNHLPAPPVADDDDVHHQLAESSSCDHQCLEKLHDPASQQQETGYNINNGDLLLWDEPQQFPNYLYWDNGYGTDETAPFSSLMGTLYLSPAYTSSFP